MREILDAESEGRRAWTFLGHPVCLRCFKALHGIGFLLSVNIDGGRWEVIFFHLFLYVSQVDAIESVDSDTVHDM